MKTSIASIENKAQRLITEQYRTQGRQISPGSVPELTQPLVDLLAMMLPHLRFNGIDVGNPNNIRILFSHESDPEQTFDIDDLSSGEKAAIALFLPFIEKKIDTMISELAGAQDTPHEITPITVIIDEPEIHLHPLLQVNLLEYMRSLTDSNQAQFIFTTHSPTMLDSLDMGELFLLSPSRLAPENQLSRLSHDVERLEAARAITGSTHLLTRGKPIVFIEGEPDSGHTASDQRIVKQLIPEIQHWAVVPTHGKAQVIRAVKDMRTARINLPGMPVFGLVDADTSITTADDSVIAWPVAMMENLLLDADAIAKVAQPYSQLGLGNVDAVRASLRNIAESMRDSEVAIRLQRALPATTVRVRASASMDVSADVQAQADELIAKLASVDIESVRGAAEATVDQILQDHEECEKFHGKKLLKAFYGEHQFNQAGLGWNAFITEIARQAAGSDRVAKLTSHAVSQICLYFPDLSPVIQNFPESDEKQALLGSCATERGNWVAGNPLSTGREDLRSRLISFARSHDGSMQSGEIGELIDMSSRIGTST